MNEVISESILTEFETSSNYDIDECLGRGAYGLVFLVHDKKSDKKLAAKLVMKSTSGERDLWPNLCHPNLLSFIRTDELSESCIVHLMPYVGSDLFHLLYEKVPSFHDDKRCFLRKKNYVRDVLNGLEYMHSRNICHMDLKVENILICYKTDKAIIGDFSTLTSADNACNTTFGLNLFVLPPEVAKRKDDAPYDGITAEMWTFGVLMLQIFTMKFNFRDNQLEDTYEKDILPKIMSSTFHKETRKSLFHLHKNARLSCEDAFQYFDFISQLLVLHPESRYSATKALKHPFLTDLGIHPETRTIRLKPKTPEKEIRSLFKRMSLYESNTTKRSIFTIEKRHLDMPKKVIKCSQKYSQRMLTDSAVCKSARLKDTSSVNTLDLQRRYSWPSLSNLHGNAVLLNRISEMLKNVEEQVPDSKSADRLQNRRGKKLKVIEEDNYSIMSVSGDCLHFKRSRFIKSIRKYRIRFRRRKPREILPSLSQNVYHSFETKPEIQFSFNPAASTSGNVMKFTGTNKPGIVKKRPKNNKKWNFGRIWRTTNVSQFYDSFADDVILLPPK
ncbi:hypothetical protein AVEN_167774-1 [Araneus ventricosus]|uniref:Protein kinase domain-containing protein n=1 Tax=Araneus ventricosus TaxID=182803 RepID=A0A4Y2J978_ARAVE|nr:hypothetical protein AVEN_167774-1 [Araneus ventricosus]